ncbi:MAG: hypothetical protein KIT33_01780 [Candidatus Kapabacteria bacterium]|nr:hypothetical protein [Ignavibacteriota bacterium]MCW5883681.1 hypothetical protein [Candidatus Kapabacteria bacterium]
MKSSLFFWGSFLIFLGIFILSNNFGAFRVSFSEVIDWWPLLLIIWGLSLLKIPLIVKNIILSLSGLLLSLLIVAMFTSGFSYLSELGNNIDINSAKSDCNSNHEILDEKVTKGVLNFSGGAGSFVISNTMDYLYEVNSSSVFCDVTIDRPNDSLVVLNYSLAGSEGTNNQSRYTKIEILEDLEWDIDISAGASKIKLDLEELKVPNLNIDAGATNAGLKLGAHLPMTKVNINCGAATLDITVPEDAGCSVQGDFALSKTSFENFTKNSSGIFVTKNYYDNVNKIDFQIDGALSNIKIKKK